jgi:hypothetical protein
MAGGKRMNYKFIEIAPEDGTRGGRKKKTTIYKGPDKAAMQQAINDYHKQPCRPYHELAYYYGSKRIYAYEL